MHSIDYFLKNLKNFQVHKMFRFSPILFLLLSQFPEKCITITLHAITLKLRKIKIRMSIINLNLFTEEISFKTAKQWYLPPTFYLQDRNTIWIVSETWYLKLKEIWEFHSWKKYKSVFLFRWFENWTIDYKTIHSKNHNNCELIGMQLPRLLVCS